tara:strand:+ start:4034 stop:4180 length:147 start_codon:yes stop_codon:yes gene_type:complete
MGERKDIPLDPFGFVKAINFEALDDMDLENLEQLNKILDKVSGLRGGE